MDDLNKEFRQLLTVSRSAVGPIANSKAEHTKVEKLRLEKIKREEDLELLSQQKLAGTRRRTASTTSLSESTAERAWRMKIAAESYIGQIKNERQLHSRIDARQKDVEREFSEVKRGQARKSSGAAQEKLNQRSLQTFMHRLDLSREKYNKLESQNRRLREIIETLKMERLVHENVSEQHEKELLESREQMKSVLREIHDMNTARDAALAETVILAKQQKKLQKGIRQKWDEILQDMQHDVSSEGVAAAQPTSKARAESSLLHRTRSLLAASKHRHSSDAAAERGITTIRKENENLKSGLATILQRTGFRSMDGLLDNCKELEVQNVHLFRHKCELDAELEAEKAQLDRQNLKMRSTKLNLHHEKDSSVDAHKRLLLRTLKKDTTATKLKADALQTRIAVLRKLDERVSDILVQSSKELAKHGKSEPPTALLDSKEEATVGVCLGYLEDELNLMRDSIANLCANKRRQQRRQQKGARDKDTSKHSHTSGIGESARPIDGPVSVESEFDDAVAEIEPADKLEKVLGTLNADVKQLPIA